ncbi:MAG: hypothetical protein ACYC1F_10425 [Gallionellaceae bacterium]
MEHPLSKLALDHWYKVLMVAGFAVFLLAAAGLLPSLPVKPALLVALGTFFFGLGEWCNHPLQTHLHLNIKITGHPRRLCISGIAFDLLGFALIAIGLWHLLR